MSTGGNHWPRRAQVEGIVRAVLAELSAGGTASSANGELVLTGKVVSLGEIEDRLKGVSRLVVPRGAVLTPSARDELRRRGVAIASTLDGWRTVRAAEAPRVVLAVSETHYEPFALVAALAADGVAVDQHSQAKLADTTEALSEKVAQGEQLGLLMTGNPAAAICLANRRRGARAALGYSARAAAEAVETIGANLLVVDPSGKSVFEMRQIARAFIGAGRRSCPQIFQDMLG